MRKKPRVVFFDIGQTLVTGAEQSPQKLLCSRLHSDPVHATAVGHLLMTHEAEDPLSLVQPLCDILPGVSRELVAREIQRLWSEQLSSAREIDGAGSVLRSLGEQGIRVGVISNIWHPFYQGLSNNHPDLVKRLDYVVLSYRTGFVKPSRELYEDALNECGESPEDCWMVGDTYELDVEPAMRLGMHTVWVLRRPDKEKSSLVRILRGEKRMPDWVAGEMSEVEHFFSRKEG